MLEFDHNDPPHAWRYHAKCALPEVYPEVKVGEIHYEAGEVQTELFSPLEAALSTPPWRTPRRTSAMAGMAWGSARYVGHV